MFRSFYDWLAYPHRLAALHSVLSMPGARILDAGCANRSPSLTRRYFPDCVYHGIEPDLARLSREDVDAADRLFPLNLEDPAALSVVPDGAYDALICSHLLEHLLRPYDVVHALAGKLAQGGVLYVETPSERSLRLPRLATGRFGARGCLNFWDDATHRSVVDLNLIAGDLREMGFDVGPVRKRRMARRIWLLPGYLLGCLIVKGFVPASVLWDVAGFAVSLRAVRSRATFDLAKHSHADSNTDKLVR